MNEATQGLFVLLSLIAMAAIAGICTVAWLLTTPKKSPGEQAQSDADTLMAKANAKHQKPTRTRVRAIS